MKKQIILIGFLAALLLTISSTCKAVQDYFKDTVWMRKTDQSLGFYQVKFSNHDSIIVGHGYGMDIFYNTFTGEEIKRIPFNTEIHFFNNDENYMQLAPSRDRLVIYNTRTFEAVDTLEYDTLSIGNVEISKDENYIVGVVTGGIRVWSLKSKKILTTKIYPVEKDQLEFSISQICITNDNSRIITSETRKFYDGYEEYSTRRHNIYDFTKLDSIGSYANFTSYRLSNTNKYIAFKNKGDSYGIVIYNFITGEFVQKLLIDGTSITGIEFSPDDKYVVTSNGPFGNSLIISEIETGKEIHRYWPSSYDCVDVSNNSKFVLGAIGPYIRLFKSRYGIVSVPEKGEILNIIYPNPTNSIATIEFTQNSSGNTIIELLSTHGILIKTIYKSFLEAGKQKIEINTSDIPSGNYFIVVKNNNEQLLFKLIVNH